MKLGRLATPKARLAAVPRLVDHLSIQTTLIADSCDYGKRMPSWRMFANDDYGDCVFASRAHHAQCASVNAGNPMRQITDERVLKWYSECTGFNRDDPSTDNGAYPIEALKYFLDIGEIIAYARVDPDNDAHVAAAIELFGGLWCGWDLPLAWQGAKIWDAGPSLSGRWYPGSWGGHMVSQVGYDARTNSPTVTWGELVHVTAAARHVYCSEAYALITQEWLDTTGRTVQGFDLAGLQKRLVEVL